MSLYRILREERTIAALVLAGGIFVGLGFPTISDAMRPWTWSALFLVSVFSLVPFANLPTTTLFSVDPDVARMVLWQQFILPCIVVAAGILARFPDSVIVLMIVTTCSGSLFSSPALAEILGLDQKRVLQVMVGSTLVMPFSLAFFLTVFRGVHTNIDLTTYGLRTIVFLIVPFLLLVAWRPVARYLTPKTGRQVMVGSRWATIGALLIFGIGLMSSVSDRLESSPTTVLFLFALATGLCVFMIILTSIVMYRFGHREALTASVGTGFRNIGLGFAIVGNSVGDDLAVYAGISLLPIFVGPLVMRLVIVASDRRSQPDACATEEPPAPAMADGVTRTA